ncbi:hypothetical protein AMAG_06544 [Allomyces macrogynus ATCC 38327]|uniref:RING-type domain-containing protein n=1 Tax=Allomyces macrogynus (strain ATCC 38327) TaxID=578462 RepID=A0A0L0SH16_ALLM3|nr:hypothetical protein AMAG_06544 [Allomyces macrogynus ATCC 38327]|eukprot:KNE61744.1 hypothetical protein AMAG_06544 [Allomyces macrogynus ATCC 38327]
MSNTVFIPDTSSSSGHDSGDESTVSLRANAVTVPSTKSSDPAPLSPPRFSATCGLCAGSLADPAAALTCGHVFHAACIEAWYAVHPTCPRHATAQCRLTGHLDKDRQIVYTGATASTAPDPASAHIREFAHYAGALAKHAERQAAVTTMHARLAKRRQTVQLARMRAHDRSLTVEAEHRREMQPVRDEIVAMRAQCDAVRRELARLDAEERAARDEHDLAQRADTAALAVKQAFQAMTAAQREFDREVELARDRDLARAQQQQLLLLRDRRKPAVPVPPSSSPPPAAAAVWDLDEYMMRGVDPVDEEDEDEEGVGVPLRAGTRVPVLLPAPGPSVPAKPALRFGKVNIAPLVGRRGAGGVGKGARAVKVKGQRTLDVYFKK